MPSLVVMRVFKIDNALHFRRLRTRQGPSKYRLEDLRPAAVEVAFQMSQVEQMRWSIQRPMTGEAPCHATNNVLIRSAVTHDQARGMCTLH